MKIPKYAIGDTFFRYYEPKGEPNIFSFIPGIFVIESIVLRKKDINYNIKTFFKNFKTGKTEIFVLEKDEDFLNDSARSQSEILEIIKEKLTEDYDDLVAKSNKDKLKETLEK